MKAETRILIVKELEKLKSIKERNSFWGGFAGLILAIIWLTGIHLTMGSGKSSDYNFWAPFNFVIALLLLLQSFYIIIRHIINKRLSIIFEAILEIKDKTEISSDKINDTVKN